MCAADDKIQEGTGNMQLRGKAAEKVFDLQAITAVEWRNSFGLVFVVV